MKIAVWHNLPSGGGKRALYYHVRGLVERGHHVEVWCPPTADQSYLPLSELVQEHIVSMDWQPISRQNGLANALAVYRDNVSKLTAMEQHCRECAEQINSGGFDLLFANCCMYHRAPAIGRYVSVPKTLYLQEPYRWLYEAIPTLPWAALPAPKGSLVSPREIKRFIGDLIGVQGLRVQVREELANAKAFDSILVNSYFSRESVLRAYGLDAKVCYLGVDTNLFENQHQPRENFVIGLGAFVPEKNLRLVIEAIGKLPEPRPHLVWVGNVASDHLNHMVALAASLDVCFDPKMRIADTELVDLLNRAMLMVYAPRLEPFGFAPLEAAACGTPVIAVAEGGVRETVVEGISGLFVEHTPASLAYGIESLLKNPMYARELGEQGSKLVAERWSFAPSIDRLESRFAELVSGEVLR